jgi:hypothetical protein
MKMRRLSVAYRFLARRRFALSTYPIVPSCDEDASTDFALSLRIDFWRAEDSFCQHTPYYRLVMKMRRLISYEALLLITLNLLFPTGDAIRPRHPAPGLCIIIPYHRVLECGWIFDGSWLFPMLYKTISWWSHNHRGCWIQKNGRLE